MKFGQVPNVVNPFIVHRVFIMAPDVSHVMRSVVEMNMMFVLSVVNHTAVIVKILFVIQISGEICVVVNE